MNPNYAHTITLYNCLRAKDSEDKKDHWCRHVLNGCFYKAAIVRTDTGANAGQQNTYVVRIPVSDRYRPYTEWIRLSPEEREQYFTMALDDVVIAGECAGEITGASGQAAMQVLSRHKPDAFKVTAVSDNTRSPYGKHYRLGG